MGADRRGKTEMTLRCEYLYIYSNMYLLEEGAGREPVGEGRRRFIHYMYACMLLGRW